MTITAIAPPEGASLDYQYFENGETGNLFKAKIQRTTASPITLNADGLEVTNMQFGVCVTTSMIDEAGQALTEDDKPVVDSLTHTFTEEEAKAEDFNPAARIYQMV